MEEFLLKGIETILNNAENVTMGVIALVVLLILLAVVFVFVNFGLKLSARNQTDRESERAGDQSVIDKLFDLLPDFSVLSQLLETMNRLAEEQLKSQELSRELNQKYLSVLEDIARRIENDNESGL